MRALAAELWEHPVGNTEDQLGYPTDEEKVKE
jgi:hypothetical protein